MFVSLDELMKVNKCQVESEKVESAPSCVDN